MPKISEEEAHFNVIRKQLALRQAMPQFKLVNGEFVRQEAKALPPLENILAAEKEVLEKKQEVPRDEVVEHLEPGQSVEGEGVYLGRYEPKDREGNSLSETFNVFAAPEDLPETRIYKDTVKYISQLKNWHGFDGTNYATDKEIYAALKEGSYNGGWIIPTRDILVGNDVDGKITMPDSILIHNDKGALKDTFIMTERNYDSQYSHGYYWSSTESSVPSFYVQMVRLGDAHVSWQEKNFGRADCRPVRLVPVKP